MKLYKLNQSSTFDNLKHFIYITNEYGVPSAEFIDAFIDQFGLVILNGNFTSAKIPIKSLELHWQGVKDECTQNNIEYKEYYGSLFYEIIGQKAVLKLKEGHTEDGWRQLSIENKLDLLKQFILDFDLHIFEGIDMYKVYFNNTPKLINEDERGKYIYIYIHENGRPLVAKFYEDNTTIILKGSQIGGIMGYAAESIIKRVEKYRKNKVVNNIVVEEIVCPAPSCAGQVYRGGTCNGWDSFYNLRGTRLDTYKEVQPLSMVDLVDSDDADTIDNLDTRIMEIIYGINYPTYEITSNAYCSRDIYYENELIGKIISDMEIKTPDGDIINIGKYIYENSIKNVNAIKIGITPFAKVFRLKEESNGEI